MTNWTGENALLFLHLLSKYVKKVMIIQIFSYIIFWIEKCIF